MKSFRRNTRGQFVIIAALLISILTLSLVLSIHQINLNQQQLSYQPVDEVVLGITSDLDRCLTHALSNATKAYNTTENTDSATANGTAFISKWVNSILTSYSDLGLKMNINETNAGLTDLSWNINWGKWVGLSQVSATFDLDIDAYGFKGWVGRSGKFVSLKIDSTSLVVGDNGTTLNFTVMQGKDQQLPIPNLVINQSLFVSFMPAFSTGGNATWIPASNMTLTYLGGGNYTVTFSPKVDERVIQVRMAVVTPDDNIIVRAYFTAEARYFVTLQSQQVGSPVPTNNGTIQLGDTTYQTLPVNSIRIEPGQFILVYNAPNENYTFVNWAVTGDARVTDTSSNVTSVSIFGNATITAFYSPIVPVFANVMLNSRDWENLTSNLGNMTVGSTTYAPLPNSTNLLAGRNYLLIYQPQNASYRFLWWESTGGAIVWDPYKNSTTVTITGDGNITAVYIIRPPVPIPDPILLSEEDNAASENLGQTQLGEVLLPCNGSNLGTPNGSYLLQYVPENESYTFLNWTITGSLISVVDPYSNPTSVTIEGNGNITAFYQSVIPAQPQTFNITLDSRESGDLSQHNGTITIDSIPYETLPNATELTAGNHTIQYVPDVSNAYVFIGWEWTGDIILWNSTSSLTALTVLGNGTVTAVYVNATAPPTTTTVEASVTFQSQEQSSSSPDNTGQIQFGDVLSVQLGTEVTTVNGTYFLEFTPAKGYQFVNWATTGNVSVANPYSATTTAIVDDNGTITALYFGYNVALNSRHWENLSFNNGSITLGTVTYSLPYYVGGLAADNYSITYVPLNSSYVFLWWEFSGNLILTNSTRNNTNMMILGNGTLTAVYTFKPPLPTSVTVTMNSTEDTGASSNLGSIQLSSVIYSLYPGGNSTTIPTGTYLLEYFPMAGYTFASWASTENASVLDTSSPLTTVTINGSAAITAIYRGYTVILDSRDWFNESNSHLGNITFGTASYGYPNLPSNLTGVKLGDYPLQYAPNATYVFLWWEQSGNVIPWNFTSNSTSVTVFGDGNLTAVYAQVPPSEWNTLYVDKGPLLVPPYMWSLKSSHIPSWASTGANGTDNSHQMVEIASPQTPMNIYLAQYVNITLYVGIDPLWNAKDITIQFGFNYSGTYYKLGNGTFPINSDGVYKMMIDSNYGQYPNNQTRLIPQGSIFILDAVVTFWVQPWGTFKLFYGPNQPSSIALF